MYRMPSGSVPLPSNSPAPLPARGVHEEPYTKDGCLVLVAIDSKGDGRKRVKLSPGVSYDRARAWLEELLDRVDPIDPPRPPLALVRDRPDPRAAPQQLHPAHVDDPRAYRARLVRQFAQRVHRFRD
jgi:hypothetical protein